MIPYSPLKYYNFGLFKIPTEPLAFWVAIIIFTIMVIYALRKEKIKMNMKEIILFLAIFIASASFGGRILYYIVNWGGPKTILYILDITMPGVFSLGFFVGGAIGILIYTLILFKKKKKKLIFSITFAKLADIVAAPAAFAIFIFRLFGCTVYGCTKGTETNLPWCFMWPDGVCRHPVTLYMALSALLIFIILKVFFGREKTKNNKFGKRFDGEVGPVFLLLYCFNRFWIEFFVVGRNMNVTKYLGLNWIQWVCLGIVFFVAVELFGQELLVRDNEYYSYESLKRDEDSSPISKGTHHLFKKIFKKR